MSASDKDLKPVFKKICQLATTELFDFSHVKNISYDAGERKKLESAIEAIREDKWLEDMYGAASTLQNAKWVEQVTNAGKWIFDSAELRKRLFEESGVQAKHIN